MTESSSSPCSRVARTWLGLGLGSTSGLGLGLGSTLGLGLGPGSTLGLGLGLGFAVPLRGAHRLCFE